MKTWRKENCITSVHKNDPLLVDGWFKSGKKQWLWRDDYKSESS